MTRAGGAGSTSATPQLTSSSSVQWASQQAQELGLGLARAALLVHGHGLGPAQGLAGSGNLLVALRVAAQAVPTPGRP